MKYGNRNPVVAELGQKRADGRGLLPYGPFVVPQETEQLCAPVCRKTFSVRVVLRAGVRFPQLVEGAQSAN